MSEKVDFAILLNDEIIHVSANPNDTIIELFQDLRADTDYGQYIPPNLPYSKCEFYSVIDPVLAVRNKVDDAFVRQAIIDACRSESNREKITHPLNWEVCGLSESGVFLSDHVYLDIHVPDPIRESKLAIGALKNDLRDLFDCLTITVQHLRDWSEEDVQSNLRGGTTRASDDHSDFTDIFAALAKPRLYKVDHDWGQDLEDALSSYETELNDIIGTASGEACTVTSGRELVAFYNILRCFKDDVGRIKNNTSSALKASNFFVFFIQPPFFSEDDDSRGFEYQQETSWTFPVFLNSEPPSGWRKYTPGSDWMVISKTMSKIPFIISKVFLQASQSGRNQMLVQAIVLARAGQYFLKPTSNKRFFVVAIYLDEEMVVSRYIVRQDPDDENRKVSIHQEDFDLANPAEQLSFLREMYNLAMLVTELSRDLDKNKEAGLSVVKDGAKKVIGLET